MTEAAVIEAPVVAEPAAADVPAPAVEPVVEAPVVEEVVEPVADPVVESDPVDTSKMSAHDLKRHHRTESRKAARKASQKLMMPGDEAEPDVTGATDPDVTVDEKGRRHSSETGEFLSNEEKEEEIAAAGKEGAAAPDDISDPDPAAKQGGDDVVPDEPGAVETAPGIRVEIDPTHPVAQMGQASDGYLEAADEKQAEVMRALLNGTYERRQAVERLETQNADLETKYAELQRQLIGIEATATVTEEWQKSPQYKQIETVYHNLKAQELAGEVEEGTASAYWKGSQGELKTLVDAEVATREGAIQSEAADRAGERWVAESKSRMQTLPPSVLALPDFNRWHQEEVESFGNRVDAGHYPHLEGEEAHHEEFRKLFAARLYREPAAVAAYTVKAKGEVDGQAARTAADAETERREKEIAEKAVEEYKRVAADTRKTAPLNPMANAAAAGTDPGTVSRDPEEVDTSKMTGHELKKHNRKLVREDTRRRVGR